MTAAWDRVFEAVALRCEGRGERGRALRAVLAGWESAEHRLAEACWRAGRDRLRRRFGAAVDAFGLGLVRVEAGGEGWQPADLRHGVRDGLAAVTLPA